MTPESPAGVVQRQLEAYNARNLERFAATYSDDIRDRERVRGIRETPFYPEQRAP